MKIKIEIQNLKFTTNEKPHLNRKYQIKIKIYAFGILPIINIKLNNKKIQQILNNNKIKEKIKEQETKIIENKANIDKELITSLKNIQTEIKEINFTFEKMIYTEFAVALSDDRKNLRKIYQSGKRPALTYLSLKAEERTRYICLLLTGSETGVRKIDIYA